MHSLGQTSKACSIHTRSQVFPQQQLWNKNIKPDLQIKSNSRGLPL